MHGDSKYLEIGSRLGRTILAILVASALLFEVLGHLNAPINPPEVTGRLASVSFSPYSRDKNPEAQQQPSREEIARDIDAVAGIARGIRTYASTDGLEVVPELAGKAGLDVLLGIRIDHDPQKTRAEVEEAIRLARENASVKAIMVGNETLLTKTTTPDELVALMREVKRRTGKPVSTGEPFDIWLDHPELVKAADFIGAHVLPYWVGTPADDAVDYALAAYGKLKQAYPRKHIVIAEFGWPSGRVNRNAAVPSLKSEADIIRRFAAIARQKKIDYNIVEAFDQAWKIREGDVGPYWGILDANRQPKFSLTEPVIPDVNWQLKWLLASLFGGIAASPLLRRSRVGWLQAFVIAGFALPAAWVVVEAFSTPFETYNSLGTALMWVITAPLAAILIAITFDRTREMSDVLLGRKLRRLVRPSAAPTTDLLIAPKVSIHVAACRENPTMLAETLRSLDRLDYPNFEVIVAINNTDDKSLVEPVAATCRALGPRFRFFDFGRITGFKAGALNRALAVTDPDAAIIALIDADYIVDPTWLKEMVQPFADPAIALVQAPQDHRDEKESLIKFAMNSEYSGFFDIGMCERNEDGAVLAHGTMLLLRREALERVGGWGEWCITEDTELGLRLYEAGYQATYGNTRMGWGVLPDNFAAFRKQRHRWAYGAMRIMLAHAGAFLSRRTRLTGQQKIHFATGWLHWFGDAAAVTMAIANLAWAILMQIFPVDPPNIYLTGAAIGACVLSIAHTLILYKVRVRRGWRATLLACLAGASLQMTVARAVISGLTSASLPFARTAKGGIGGLGERWLSAPLIEGLLGMALVGASAMVSWLNRTETTEIYAFAAVLAVQAIPFLACAGFRLIELAETALRARAARPAPIPAEPVDSAARAA